MRGTSTQLLNRFRFIVCGEHYFNSTGESTVHPHVCGEHELVNASGFTYAGMQLLSIVGSSPRMRGTLGNRIPTVTHRFIPTYAGNTRMVRTVDRRFIPTYAGNTFVMNHGALSSRRDSTVHPHVCGEHKIRIVEVGSYLNGSSPRMRGTPFL